MFEVGHLVALGLGFLAGALQLEAQQNGYPDVAAQMRHVDYHIDSSTVLSIEYLRGALHPTSPEHSPYFDEKNSFQLKIDSARIAVTPANLSNLLNHYTFAFPGSPLRGLKVSIEQARLKMEGRMRGISFSMLGDLTLTDAGELRIHPVSMKAVGIKVGGLMKFLGLNLDKLIKARGDRGVRIEKNDFYLAPSKLLPPPQVLGRLGKVEVNDSAVVLMFEPDSGRKIEPLTIPKPKVENYMFYRGGTLRFGKLTMHDTDLFIEDPEPKDPFDFFLDEYNAQLVAGYSKNTPDHGLITVMQDWKRTPPLKTEKGRSKTGTDEKAERLERGERAERTERTEKTDTARP
jgi:hypothetical protein